MIEEALYNPEFHCKMDYEIFILHRRTPKKLFDVVGYELSVINPARYTELSELLGIKITNNDPFIISKEDYIKFSDFVKEPSRHYMGVLGDKSIIDN